jgi:hypothetical protein
MSSIVRSYDMRINSINDPGKYSISPIHELEYSGISLRGAVPLHEYFSDIKDRVIRQYRGGKCRIDNLCGSLVVEANKGRNPFSKMKCIVTPKKDGVDIVVPNSSPFTPEVKSLCFMDSVIRNTPIGEIVKDCLGQNNGMPPEASEELLISITPLADKVEVI